MQNISLLARKPTNANTNAFLLTLPIATSLSVNVSRFLTRTVRNGNIAYESIRLVTNSSYKNTLNTKFIKLLTFTNSKDIIESRSNVVKARSTYKVKYHARNELERTNIEKQIVLT